MKEIIYIVILTLFFGCLSEKSESNLIEGDWISSMKAIKGELNYETNTFFQLKNGRGVLSNIGQNTLEFDYKINKSKRVILVESGGERGQLKILSNSKDKLTLINYQKDTIYFQRLLDQKITKRDLQKCLMNNTFEIVGGIQEKKKNNELYHFNEKRMLTIAEFKANPNPNIINNKLKIQHYYIQNIEDWQLINLGGKLFVKLVNFESYGNHPIYGFVEYIDKERLGMEVFINGKRDLIELERVKSKAKNHDEILGEWGDSSMGLSIKMMSGGKLEYTDKMGRRLGDWSIDSSGKIITFKSGRDFMKFATVDDKRNSLNLKYTDNLQMSIHKMK